MDFYSNGKLLLTSEYLVLNGATALALPTKYGQSLRVSQLNTEEGVIFWESYDSYDKIWFSCKIEMKYLNIINTTDKTISNVLLKIFNSINKYKPFFLRNIKDLKIETFLSFDRNWGLGSSSTLINNLASWANIDAFTLQFEVFGGSAYDIACAQNDNSILYNLYDNKPVINVIDFNPSFKENIFFVYLNRKQNSRDAIKEYIKNTISKSIMEEASNLTTAIVESMTLYEFEDLIKIHENLIASVLNVDPIKKRLFSDFSGQIKSLGAWGGDFILATGNLNTMNYFKKKGFETIIPYSKMIL